jgi:hypothetical protein
MAKLTPKEQLIWMLFSLPTGAGFTYFSILAARQLGFGIPSELLSAAPTCGISLAFGAWSLYQLQQIGLLKQSRRRRTAGVSTTFESLREIAPAISGTRSWQMKWKEEPDPPEFEFWGNGLDGMIPESIFHRFVKMAWRRQCNALYGTKYSMLRDDNRINQLTVNQVFTQSYYTKRIRPVIPDEDYYGCLHVLMATNLIRGRRQGRGGVLRWPPDTTLERAKARWYTPPPPARKSLLKRIFYN